MTTVGWGAGNYGRTAAEIEPVAQAVVSLASLRPHGRVVDLACGTGSAAILAAASVAAVVGVDAAPRLLDVARERARTHEVEVDFREGDLLDLPVKDAAADVALSDFGVLFASDPSRAVSEIARILRSDGRALISAWVPNGPIISMVGAMDRMIARATGAPPPEHFPWSEPAAVAALARDAGRPSRDDLVEADDQ